MKNKRNSLTIALTALTALMTLVVASSRIHTMLDLGSIASTIKFYFLCLIFCGLVGSMIVMASNKEEAKEDNKTLHKQITEEYKAHMSIEVRVVSREIIALKEAIEDVGETMKTTNGNIVKTNERIDTLILNSKN